MIDLFSMTLHAQMMEDGSFFLYFTDQDHKGVGADMWKHSVFLWHEPSFYGTLLEKGKKDGQEGIILSPAFALSFFRHQADDHILGYNMSSETRMYKRSAEAVHKAIESESFEPDFSSWKEGKMAWKADHLTSIEQQWLSSAVNETIETDEEVKDVWEELVASYPLLKPSAGDVYVFDEQDWHEKVGWVQSAIPFSFLLRLQEPETDGEFWKLETLLRDQQTHTIYSFSDKLPKEWEGYEPFIDRQLYIIQTLVPELFSRKADIKSSLSEEEVWKFLTQWSLSLLEAGFEIQLPSWWQAVKEAQLSLKASLRDSESSNRSGLVGLQSLLDFNWKISTRGINLSEEQFLQLVEQKRRLIQINGQWIQLDPVFVKHVQRLMTKAQKEGLRFFDVLEQELTHQEKNQVMLEDGELKHPFSSIQIEVTETFAKLVNQLHDYTSLPEKCIPPSFLGALRSYQQQGVNWLLFLRDLGLGGCLADDMGLGKTVQLLAYLCYVHTHEKTNPFLIVCPTSVIGNWQKELEKFAPHLRVYTHYGPKRWSGDTFLEEFKKTDVVITSYPLLSLDVDDLSKPIWGAVILDEAQHIKNAQTKQARAARKLKSTHNIALTGTPIENRLTELWSIFDFMNPGYLGSLNRFKTKFATPIEKQQDKEQIQKLQKLVRPFMLRRTKQDEEVALNLPPKQEQREYVSLTLEQASLYEQLVKDTFAEIQKLTGFERKGVILKLLTRLKQLCDHPSLYLKESRPKQIAERSLKLEKLLELVEHVRLQNESCLIFTQYIEMGHMMQQTLEKALGEKVLFLHGSLSKDARDDMIAAFQEKKAHVFILSLHAGGTGLNLTAANHVIHFDRWWNPAVENQATDRAYRYGQTRFVHVHKLITLGTIEEKIDQIIEKKTALNEQIIQNEQWITELTDGELEELFSYH
ncbi:DEAD/DEAH box helicase [Bacillus songklensis]|uniref:DEAD/DEAH box helicase n=1 Tax=Bacillus songklensis TaxID=1069116 RepID=A0ABV8BBH6_9BACI